jgi:GTP cyclohydrolase I
MRRKIEKNKNKRDAREEKKMREMLRKKGLDKEEEKTTKTPGSALQRIP